MSLIKAFRRFMTRLDQSYSSRLDRQLLAGIGQIGLGGAILSCLVIGFTVYQVESSTWRSRQMEMAVHFTHEVSDFLSRQVDNLRLLDHLGRDEMEEQPQILENVLTSDPVLLEVIYLDQAGQILAYAAQGNPVLANNFNPARAQWFIEALAGKTYYSATQLTPQGEHYLIVAVPGEGGGVIAARLDMLFLQPIINAARFGESGRTYLVDGQGQVIAHPDMNYVRQHANLSDLPGLQALSFTPGQVFYSETPGLDGRLVIGAKAPVEGIDWQVITEMNAWEFYRSSRLIWLLLLSGGSLLFILAIRLVNRLLDRLILKPVAQLQAGAHQVGMGNLDYRVDLGRVDEIGQVAAAFDGMAADLNARQQQLAEQREALRELNEQLEERVAERTALLSQANADLRREIDERQTAEAQLLERSEALRASEAKYRELFENVMDGVFRTSPQGYILTANPALVRLLGYESLEALQAVDIARDLYVNPQEREISAARLQVEGAYQNIELQLRRQDGRVVTVLENTHAVHSENGELLYFEGTLTDITERKQAESLLEAWSSELQRKNYQQERLIAAAHQLTTSLDVHAVLHNIALGAKEILNGFGCVIYLVEDDGSALKPVVAIDPQYEEEILEAKLSVETSLNGRAIRAGKGLIFNTPLDADQAFQIPGTSVDQTERVIVAPLIADGAPFGSLCLNRMDADFTAEELLLAETFAAYASTALKNAQAHASLQREIEERVRVEEALRESEERYSLSIQGANDGLWDWDLRSNRVYYSPRWKTMLGCAEDAIGESPDEWLDRIHQDDQEQVKVSLSRHLQGLTPHFENEHRIRHQDGSYRWVQARGLAVRSLTPSAKGPVLTATRLAGSLSDITARKEAENQLLHDAFHDALTGLPNRALFLDRLGRTLERTYRRPENPFSVLFLDLDRFKVINDSLGHSVGDELLIGIARRLGFCLRTADTAARLGGDEFVILLEDIQGVSDAEQVAERIRAELKLPFLLHGHEVVVSTSIGIVFGPSAEDGPLYQHPEEVLRDADIALYKAKELGKDCSVVFSPALRTLAIDRMALENELRSALERSEFQLHYQPIRCLSSERLTGFEALLRWNSPLRGFVPPGKFIHLAEETGLIVPIGEWVLRTACRQLRKWQSLFPADPPLTINVNISGVQFAHPGLLEQVQAALSETGLPAASLRLEITESVFMQQAEETAEKVSRALEELRQLGVQLHIDDFGTGYSSLAYLQRFPVSTIKIDRSFVERIGSSTEPGAGIGTNGNGSEIIRTIVTLARDLGMDAVAEGVETQEQLEQLKALDCPFGQGYFIARPMDADAAQAMLQEVGACSIPDVASTQMLTANAD